MTKAERRPPSITITLDRVDEMASAGMKNAREHAAREAAGAFPGVAVRPEALTLIGRWSVATEPFVLARADLGAWRSACAGIGAGEAKINSASIDAIEAWMKRRGWDEKNPPDDQLFRATLRWLLERLHSEAKSG